MNAQAAHCDSHLLGHGIHYPIALEGVSKLKKISYIHTEGYPADKMKYGLSALIDESFPVVCIATKDSTGPPASSSTKTLSNIREVTARIGRVIAIKSDTTITQIVEPTTLLQAPPPPPSNHSPSTLRLPHRRPPMLRRRPIPQPLSKASRSSRYAFLVLYIESMSDTDIGLNDTWSKRLDAISKCGAVALFFSYSCGYLILSLFYTSFGITLGDPFRSQMIVVGVVFLILTGAPVWIAYHTVIRANAPTLEGFFSPVLNQVYRLNLLCLASITLALPAAIFFSFNFKSSELNRVIYIALFLFMGAFWPAVTTSRHLSLFARKQPWALWLFGCFTLGFWIWIAYDGTPGFGYRHLSLWFYFSGFVAALATVDINVARASPQRWPFFIIQWLFCVVLYAKLIYPHILSSWGGGQLMQITVDVYKDSSLHGSDSHTAKLLLENGNGIYIVDPQTNRASFIPKERIASIRYGSAME